MLPPTFSLAPQWPSQFFISRIATALDQAIGNLIQNGTNQSLQDQFSLKKRCMLSTVF